MNAKNVLLLAVFSSAGLSIQAQTLLSDFSTSANFTSSGSLLGNGALVIPGGVANYTVASPTTNDQAYIGYTGAVGSYISNWSVRIDIAYAAPSTIFTSGVEQAINVGISVSPTGSSFGLNGSSQPTFNNFAVNANLFQDASNAYSSEFRTGYYVANTNFADDTSRYAQSSVSGAWLSSIRISFNSTTKMLTAAYDADGPTGGYIFSSMAAISQDRVDASTWGMSASDTFSILINGNSLRDGASGLGPTISAGSITLDNLTGNNLTAVPEPSTYAAICGIFALGFAQWKRRRQRAKLIAPV